MEQKTEDTIGPYELHDFFLYYTVRHSFAPTKVFVLARQAFDGVYSPEVILKLVGAFLSALLQPAVQALGHAGRAQGWLGGIVPRGDWRMPSDASSALWLAEVAALRELVW